MKDIHEITEAIQQHPDLGLEQQIEAWQAENELLRAELDSLQEWARQAYKVIQFASGIGGWDASPLLNDAPATVRAKEASTDGN